MEPKERKTGKVEKIWSAVVYGFFPVIFIGGMIQAWWESPPQAEREAALLAIEQREELDRANNKKKGLHCLSHWDGSHPGFVSSIKSRLNDGSSFEHIETYVTPEAGGQHEISMRYNARNGFGALVTGTASGYYDHESCKAVVTSAQ